MNVRRLKILRTALIKHASAEQNLVFDLAGWITIPEKYADVGILKVISKALKRENFCGTTACACGLATTIPSFKRDGLGLDVSSVWGIEPTYNSKHGKFTGWEAAAKFFGLSEEDTVELFSQFKYDREDRKNPLAVADKITALLHTV